MKRWFFGALALTVSIACSTEEIGGPLPDASPSTGRDAEVQTDATPADGATGGLDAALDGSVDGALPGCEACDPPRDGMFCGYTQGCGAMTSALACHFDGSGDAAFVQFCACDGVTSFSPGRYGGENGQWAADQPFSHQGPCGGWDSGVGDAGVLDVGEGVPFDSGS